MKERIEDLLDLDIFELQKIAIIKLMRKTIEELWSENKHVKSTALISYTALTEQLTVTQQALDSSRQTNQVLVNRLKIVEECLEIILYSGCLDGVVPTRIREKVEATLNAIKGK